MDAPDDAIGTEPAFAVTPAAGEAGPFVFASPHSGERLPADMGADPDLAPEDLASANDLWMDRLVEAGPRHGAPLIRGLIGRAYLDLNRGPEEWDPQLVDAPPPGCEAGGAKAAAGYGVVHRLTGGGRPLYARRLDRAEVERRLARVHGPYHAALAGLMQAAQGRHGRAVLVDWHSMPGRAGQADVVLGDRHGSSCGRDLTRTLRTLFERQGLKVALNHPYAGGYSTRLWGRPGAGYEAVQVEISRSLYVDPRTGGPSAGYGRCRAALDQVIAGLVGG